MALYINQTGKLKEVKEKPFKLEKDIKKDFEANLYATMGWELVNKIQERVQRENLLAKISETVLQTKNGVSSEVLSKYLNVESRENYIKSAIINLMSTPEYQLC